jgi:predicted Zn-dependent protease
MQKSIFCKGILLLTAGFSLFLGGCSTNPATGRSQFDGLMSRESEASIGAQQHDEIVAQYGGVYKDAGLQAYVNEIGQRVARNTERRDVNYKFTLLDSPIVNAFALPGGYVYVTRGLLAVANDEAELAGVLGHEIGHVTGRHQAARYSQGVLTTLGASIVGAAVGDANITRALGVGNNLYMSSYSRDQEMEADALGIRYLSRAEYATQAMGSFLGAMGRYVALEGRIEGKEDQSASYFSSHPQTQERVSAAAREARSYPPATSDRGADRYLKAISGMTYGDSADQGFVRGRDFYHPSLGFTFKIPANYQVSNQPTRIAAAGPDGSLIVVDRAQNRRGLDPVNYLVQDWMQGERMNNPEEITINGMRAATDSFPGTMNGRQVNIRVVAIEWSRNEVYRFQIAIPAGLGTAALDDLKSTTYSFRRMTDAERATQKPQRIALVKAGAGDTVETLARRMQVDKAPAERFRVLNDVTQVTPGRTYKIITD